MTKSTLIEIGLVEVIRSRDIHIVQASNLSPSVLILWTYYFATYITMPSEMLQQFYLSQGTLRQNLLAENICHFLNRNAFLSLGIRGSTEEKSISRYPA